MHIFPHNVLVKILNTISIVGKTITSYCNNWLSTSLRQPSRDFFLHHTHCGASGTDVVPWLAAGNAEHQGRRETQDLLLIVLGGEFLLRRQNKARKNKNTCECGKTVKPLNPIITIPLTNQFVGHFTSQTRVYMYPIIDTNYLRMVYCWFYHEKMVSSGRKWPGCVSLRHDQKEEPCSSTSWNWNLEQHTFLWAGPAWFNQESDLCICQGVYVFLIVNQFMHLWFRNRW